MKQELGKKYDHGENVVQEGDEGDCMFVVQSGKVHVVMEKDGKEVFIKELGEGDFFGEMALFTPEVRSATVRAEGDAVVLTVDKRTLLGKIQQEPSLAFRILEHLSMRIKDLNDRFARIRGSDRRNWEDRPEALEED
jgi:CRP-like cAMP-binding protein